MDSGIDPRLARLTAIGAVLMPRRRTLQDPAAGSQKYSSSVTPSNRGRSEARQPRPSARARRTRHGRGRSRSGVGSRLQVIGQGQAAGADGATPLT